LIHFYKRKVIICFLMELDTLLESLHSTLLNNDKELEGIDDRRKELKLVAQEEEKKIAAMCSEIQSRVLAAGDTLVSKCRTEFKKLDAELFNYRETIAKASLVVCEELDKITEATQMGEVESAEKIDLADCWDKLKDIMTAAKNWQAPMKSYHPTFHSSQTLARLKSSDLGYINTAEFHPYQYQLSLTSPSSSKLEVGIHQKAICTVVTSELFTDMIQADIKFSIKIKGSTERVTYCKEECKLCDDKKSFQIAFLVTVPGTYIVTVLLYGQHIVDSPLSVIASESLQKEESQHLKAEECTKEYVTNSKRQVYNILNRTDKSDPTTNGRTDSSSAPATSNMKKPHAVSPTLSNPDDDDTEKFVPPTGPLDLTNLTPGSRLVGRRVLSINVGVKEDTLSKPIGMCLLQNGNIVVASTGDCKVKIFTPDGKFLSEVSSPKPPFDRPTDMVTLHSGQFVVRDTTRVQVFSAKGDFVKNMWKGKGQAMCYGLAQDKEGRLITIMESKRPRKTDLLFFDLDTGELVKRIELEDIITNKALSKCRFLIFHLNKLYITDLGMDCVYVLDPYTRNAKVFGKSGSGPGELSDPAGLVLDTVGTMIVADSKNHRLCVFTRDGKFVSNVSLSPDAKRPSGVTLDIEKKELYVLNLHGKFAMSKYKLG